MPATNRPVSTRDRTYERHYIVDVNGQAGFDQVVFTHPNGLCVVCLSERHPMCGGTRSSGGSGGGGCEQLKPRSAGEGKRKREEEPALDDVEERGAGAAGAEGAEGAEPPTDAGVSYGAVVEVDFRDVRARGGSHPPPGCGKGKGHQANAAVQGKHKRGAKVLMENSGVARLVDASGKYWTARSCVKGKLLEVNERLLKEPHLAVNAPTREGFLAVIMPLAKDLESMRQKALNADAYEALRAGEQGD